VQALLNSRAAITANTYNGRNVRIWASPYWIGSGLDLENV